MGLFLGVAIGGMVLGFFCGLGLLDSGWGANYDYILLLYLCHIHRKSLLEVWEVFGVDVVTGQEAILELGYLSTVP